MDTALSLTFSESCLKLQEGITEFCILISLRFSTWTDLLRNHQLKQSNDNKQLIFND